MDIKNLAAKYVWGKSIFLMIPLNYIAQNGEVGCLLPLSASIILDSR